MRFKSWSKVITSIILLAMLASLPLLSACSSDDDTDDGDTGDTGDTTLDIFEVIQEAAQDYLGSSPTWAMTADALETLVTDASTANDPIIVDVRSSYASGHIEDAINIGLTALADADSLAQLDADKQIVTYCVTGHTGSYAAAVWNMLGYNATTVKFGMCGWKASLSGTSCYDYANAPDETTVTTASTAGSYDLPDLGESTDDAEDILIDAAADFLDSSPTWAMTATALKALLDDASTANDPIIVDVRSSGYDTGHIEGAISIPLTTLAADASLQKLDPDKQIVTYCVTGHTGSQAAAILNMLGYDATTLKHGMCGWKASLSGTSCYSATSDQDNATVTS